jgi:hypothetical protein
MRWNYGDSLLDARGLGFSLHTLDPDAAASPRFSRAFSTRAQKPRVVFEPITEPIILGPEADQHPGRFSSRGMTISSPSASRKKPREIVLDFG